MGNKPVGRMEAVCVIGGQEQLWDGLVEEFRCAQQLCEAALCVMSSVTKGLPLVLPQVAQSPHRRSLL